MIFLADIFARKKSRKEIWLGRLWMTVFISVIVFVLVMAGIGIRDTILS